MSSSQFCVFPRPKRIASAAASWVEALIQLAHEKLGESATAAANCCCSSLARRADSSTYFSASSSSRRRRAAVVLELGEADVLGAAVPNQTS
ncbi:hypothetical protein PAHAL_5G255200 [Panicum hallii]|uniref:Uncharacterized protein n=1 Tax=Panicum hallii TaxID=206008 RepID=A0A2T8IL76_9POAL|nr:hypothetical protein PAHAL_5G255200 [Panicum hallii]